MSGVAECISNEVIVVSAVESCAKLRYEYIHDPKNVGIFSFDIITALSNNFNLVWNISGTTYNNGEIFQCKKIELNNKSDKKVYGNLKIASNNLNSVNFEFSTNSLPFVIDLLGQPLVRCEKFTFTFEIYYKNEYPQIEGNKLKIIEDYEKLLENKESCDVIFVVEDEEISAHKLIVVARCNVFAAMFGSEMLENKTGRVEVADIGPKIFKLFLRYIYCGKFESEDTNELLEVIVAANKYQVEDLVQICECRLSCILSVDNVVDILIVADLVNAESLKEKCISMIINEKEKIIGTSGYKKLREFHHVVLQIFETMMKIK